MRIQHFLPLTVLSLLTALPAQVPPNWGVFCAFKEASNNMDFGGIVMFNSRNLDQYAVIQGLGPDLTGQGTSAVDQGCGSILVRPSDGALVVGEFAPSSELTVDIHLITLNGNNVVQDIPFTVGFAPANGVGRILQMGWLADGRVAFAYRDVSSGVLNGRGIGILDLNTGQVTDVPLTIIPFGTLDGMTVDWTGTKVLFGVFGLGSLPISSRILEVPISGGIPISKSFFVGTLSNLAVDNDDDILIGASGGTSGLLRIPAGSAVTGAISPTMDNVTALTVDRMSGDYLVFGEDNMNFGGWRVDPAGVTTQFYGVMPVPQGVGSGIVSGVALRNSVEYYGSPTTIGQEVFRWRTLPSPMSDPQVGNINFGVRTSSTSPSAIGFMGLATAPANLPVPLGFTAWINPAAVGSSVLVPPGGNVFVPVPIPNRPSLAGINLYSQVIYIDNGSFGATQGQQITIF